MPKTSNTILLKHEEFTSDIPIEADGKIHRYTMPFNNGNPPYTKYTSAYQAQAILDDFKQLLAENPQAKIAITYAANNKQAVDIMNGYKTNRCSIDGGGQAQMFMELLKKLELPENQLLKSQIHILPIATSLRAGGDGTVTEDIIKRDMTNIAKHLGAGWTVLGLCNQYTDQKDYAVGGENSKKVWGEEQKNIFIPAMQQMVGGIDDAIKDPDDGFNYLRQAYQAAKSNPLLVNNTSLSPNNLNKINNEFLPSDSSIGLDSNFMEKVDIKDLEELAKSSNTNFKAETDPEKIKQGYKGTINEDNEDLMHITNKGLICPEVKNKEKQATIIALTLNLIKTKNNIPEDQPLVVKANNFSAEDLAIIITALKKQNINIQFDITEEKDPSIINLIKEKGVLYDKTNPAPASKKSLIPALTPKEPKPKP